MDVTLDDYLAEVDRWKQAVVEKMIDLSVEERAKEDQEALDWMETKLGRRLKKAHGSAALDPTS